MSKESKKFKVPDELANLYDFANSLDVRHFTHHGVQHAAGRRTDRAAGTRGVDGAARLVVRRAARSRPRCSTPRCGSAPAFAPIWHAIRRERRKDNEAVRSLNKAMKLFPLVVEAQDRSRHGAAGLPRRCAGRTVSRRRRALRRFHQWNAGSAEDVRGRRVPTGVLRPVEAGDAAVVHVDAVRQPDEDQAIASVIAAQAEVEAHYLRRHDARQVPHGDQATCYPAG